MARAIGGYSGFNPMYSHYNYNLGGNITVTVTNLQTAAYDIYIYGHADADNANGVYTLSVGGTNYGTEATSTGRDGTHQFGRKAFSTWCFGEFRSPIPRRC